MGSPRTTPQVLDYLIDNPGRVVCRQQIAEATALSAQQIRSAVQNLRVRSGENIEVVIHGESWIWRPREVEEAATATPEPAAPVSAAPAQRRVFEQIGTTRSGDLVIQDEDGSLYRATVLS